MNKIHYLEEEPFYSNDGWSAESIELDTIENGRITFKIGYENYFRDHDYLYGSLSPEDAIKLGEQLIKYGKEFK
jgi:hypothetical protein